MFDNWDWKVLGLVSGMLITGSINTLTKKAQFNTKAEGIDGKVSDFNQPWFQTYVMFIGEMCCLIGLFYQRWSERREALKQQTAYDSYHPIMDANQLKQPPIFQWILVLPTLCDLAGSTLSGVGFLWIWPSVWQMLRGSIIIFTGIFSIVFLKRKLLPYHWAGMTVTTLGLALVGVSSILSASGEAGYKLYLGIGLLLLGQVCSAVQMVVEETYVKGRGYPPLQVVGMEGFFGTVIMMVLFLPVIYFIPGDQPSHFDFGSYENTLNAFVKIYHSPLLLALNLIYLLSIAFFNYFGLSVTKSLTSVHRTLIDACRTVLVWACSLFIYYVVDVEYGEPWTKYSPIQVTGFFMLILGTLIYNSVLKLPGFNYVAPQTQTETPPKYEDIEATESLLNKNNQGQVN
eukprot:TRINITY_DN3823_c0_g1_i1.p1 TRINITY_DN3823_c0_g1~~TRINITY_DN3823_c0_g1_i1.p1  ORF type:complete len:401 (-),score=103.01 TRINITY_DN3823_c0_g1_i1:69-1271(-)